jgi:hypothetical protein
MFNINRRTLLRNTGIAGALSLAASLFPEMSPLAAFAQTPEPAAKPWYVQKSQAQVEASEIELQKHSSNLLPRVRHMIGKPDNKFASTLIDEDMPAKMVISHMADGTTVTTWARPLDSRHVIVVYTEHDKKGRAGRSSAQVWGIDADTKSAGVLMTGSGIETMTPLHKHDSTSAARPAAANAIDCGSAAYPCSTCAGFDGGFIDCCGPCVFAFAAFWWGVACVAAWCTWCIGEHCTNWQQNCCTG